MGCVIGWPKPGLTGRVKSRGVVHVMESLGVQGFDSESGRTRMEISIVMTRSRSRMGPLVVARSREEGVSL